MKTTAIIKPFVLVTLLVFSQVSCEKNDPRAPEVEIAEDDALATDMFDDVFAEVEDAMAVMEDNIYNDGLKSGSAVTCRIISVEHPDDSTFWPRTVTIDYGEGCIGSNGRTRRGKIIIVVNQRYSNEEYYRTVTFENFYVDDYRVEGLKSVTNEGKNENGNICFAVTLTGGKITTHEGQEISKEYSRMREWVSGSETPRLRRDDEYMITGESSGINREGVAYTRTIVEPLYLALNCRWIKSGSIQLEAGDREMAILDYGDGSCDRFATVTVGENTWTIRLHR